MLPDTKFASGKAALAPGDSLVVFSDGLLDLRPDLATREVQLPAEARRAGSAQEMVSAVNGLMDRFPNLRFDPDAPAPELVGGIEQRGMSALPVRLT